MTLEFELPRNFENLEELTEWVWKQVKSIESEFNLGREAFYLKELHAEPRKPRDGMVVLADGTDWNPGAGAGFYGRRGGAWVKLG